MSTLGDQRGRQSVLAACACAVVAAAAAAAAAAARLPWVPVPHALRALCLSPLPLILMLAPHVTISLPPDAAERFSSSYGVAALLLLLLLLLPSPLSMLLVMVMVIILALVLRPVHVH